MTTTLSNRLALERHRAFVGRKAERSLFEAAVSSLPVNVLVVHGPGGVGKTSLLRELAYLCETASIPAGYADARNIDPSPEAFMDALSKASGFAGRDFLEEVASSPARRVVLVDTCEELSPLDGWMEESFFPRLPENLLVVFAGLDPPPAIWRLDPGWRTFAKTVQLGNLTDEEGREYLEKREVPEGERPAILDFTHGHPLALSLIADSFSQRPGYRFRPETSQNAIRTLLGQFVRHVPGPAHRAALESCALVRHTTEAILQKMLSMPDVHELFDWLRSLAFVESGPLGLFPHDTAREALACDLHWRNPDWHAELHRRAREYYAGRLRQTSGLDQQRALFDYGFLHRDNPDIRPFLEWRETDATLPEPMRPDDLPHLVAMVEKHEGGESARIAARWLARHPENATLHRDPNGSPCGFLAKLDLGEAAERDRKDPAVAAAWRHLEGHAPLRSGERATIFRFWMARDTYQEVSAIQSLIFANVAQHYLSTPRLAFTFFPVADPDFWSRAFAYLDLARLEDADFEVGNRRYGVYAHDWRTAPPTAWLELLAEREISSDPLAKTPHPDPTILLAEAEFASAVREALKNYCRPDALHRSILLRSRLVSGVPEEEKAPKLKAEISAAIASLEEHPRDAKLHRALHHTFIQPAPTQEQAAELLGLPFSTYRRHLKAGTKRVADILWEKEIDG